MKFHGCLDVEKLNGFGHMEFDEELAQVGLLLLLGLHYYFYDDVIKFTCTINYCLCRYQQENELQPYIYKI